MWLPIKIEHSCMSNRLSLKALDCWVEHRMRDRELVLNLKIKTIQSVCVMFMLCICLVYLSYW